MGEQIAVVLDTNFIFAKAKQMDSLLQALRERYEVYITQVSVDERKERMCREFEKGYKELQLFHNEFAYVIGLAKDIEINEALDKLRYGMQKKYESAFSDHIIPCYASKELLETVLDRANKKISPFSTDDKASDKGFKDTLIWLSVLEYFRAMGEDEVILVSNDGGFRKDMDSLCKEFNNFTGKNISIKDSSFYKAVAEPQFEKPEQKTADLIPYDINYIRERLQSIISDLCGVDGVDYWGNPEWERTFTLSEQVDGDYMKVVFGNLKQDIIRYLFKTSVPAEDILGLDDRVTSLAPIPMDALEAALSLYEEIKVNMPDYLPQFYDAAASVINNNYLVVTSGTPVLDEDDDLPF